MIMENGEELVYRQTMPVRHFSRRFSLCYALMMIGAGLQLPFLPLWLAHKQLSVNEIAFVIAAIAGCRMVSVPFTAMLADKFRNRRALIIGFGIASVAGYGLLAVANGFHQILFCSILAATFTAPIFPLAEGFSSEGSSLLGADYGRIRLWASLSFLAGNVGGGLLLLALPTASVVYLIILAQLISAATMWLLPPDPSARAMTRAFHDRPFSSIKPLVSKSFGLLVLAASLGQSAHAMLYSFGSIKWTEAGFSAMAIGFLWASAVLCEVLFLYFSRPLVERFGPYNLMAIGVGAGALRWLLMIPDLGFGLTFLVQMMHALSFAALHLGTMHCLLQTVPRSSRNLAQGVYAAASGGLAMMVMTGVAGAAYVRLGGGAYLVMTGVSLAALAFVLALRRTSPKVPQEPVA